MRPFVLGAKVNPLGCSRPLQRAIVDFAADQPFAQARTKLLEHYGVGIGESTIQRVTFGHAAAMFEAGRAGVAYPSGPGAFQPIIVETDGGMVPTVEPNREAKDKRKGKTLSWREAKLSLAHVQGSVTPAYAGSIEGGVEAAGRQLLACAVCARFGTRSLVHTMGDGAPHGMTEAALHTACLLGRRFGLISFGRSSRRMYDDLVRRCGPAERMAAFETIDLTTAANHLREGAQDQLVLEASDRLIEAGADVVVVTGAAVAGIAHRLGSRVPVPMVARPHGWWGDGRSGHPQHRPGDRGRQARRIAGHRLFKRL